MWILPIEIGIYAASSINPLAARGKSMKKFKILKDKNGGIYDIVDAETKERTEPLKRALNMFKGQPVKLARKRQIVYYVTQCVLGNEEEISRLHYIWNHPEEEEGGLNE